MSDSVVCSFERDNLAMAYFLPHLHSAYAVDCAIQDETEKLVVIRFGHDYDRECMLVCAIVWNRAHI